MFKILKKSLFLGFFFLFSPVFNQVSHAYIGNVLTLHGYDEYAWAPHSESLDLTGDQLTLEAWVQVVGTSGNHWIICKQNIDSIRSYGFYICAETRRVIPSIHADWHFEYEVGEAVLEYGTWYHVAIVYNGSKITAFVNGLFNGEADLTGNLRQNIEELTIGGTYWLPSDTTNGSIDEVRIWSVARTQAEIQANYDVSLSGNEPGLMGYWKFDEMEDLGVGADGSNDYRDYSGNGNHLDFIPASPQQCVGDFDGDGDVDGSDLATFIQNNQGISLMTFSENFGRNNCFSPVATILSPDDLAVYSVGTFVPFQGEGFDEEDGELDGPNLVWTSNLNGIIGEGKFFSLSTLSIGDHLITLQVMNSNGATSTRSRQIRVSGDTIEVYPSGNISNLSDLFLVEVYKDGEWVNTNAHQYTRQSVDPNYYGGYYPWVHWTTIGIDIDAKAPIKITRLNRDWGSDPFVSVEILPSRYNINPIWNTDTIEFEIEQNQKIYVKINNQEHDTLFVFGAPLKPPIPNNAKYFGMGVHDVGLAYKLSPVEKDLYLDGGAWVIGTFDIREANDDVRIIGPGILSGEFEIWENIRHLDTHERWQETFPYMMIHTGYDIPPTFDLLIRGITIIGSPFYNIAIYGLNGRKYVDNVHIISPWTWNTDGINLGSNAIISNSFVFNNDDTIHPEYIFDGDITVFDCVFAGRNAFLIGYGYWGSGDPYQANIFDIDLILQYPREPFRAEVDGVNSGIIIDNQTYENITIDSDVNRLAYLVIEDTPWGAQTPAQGNIRNLIFRNIQVKGIQHVKSVIKGKDQNNRIDNIVFENLIINGIHVTNDNCEQFFDIDWETVTVSFL